MVTLIDTLNKGWWRCTAFLRSAQIRLKNTSKLRRVKRIIRDAPHSEIRLHVGCGSVRLEGWINSDIEGNPDLFLDVTKRFPFPDGSVKYVYSEHMIEHIGVDDAAKCFKEFHRILAPGGVARIATPDLDYVIGKFNGDWKNQDWLSEAEYKPIQTRAEMINMSFRGWGHKYLYNEEELIRRLRSAGFAVIGKAGWGESSIQILSNLETRKDSKLIVEARKT